MWHPILPPAVPTATNKLPVQITSYQPVWTAYVLADAVHVIPSYDHMLIGCAIDTELLKATADHIPSVGDHANP